MGAALSRAWRAGAGRWLAPKPPFEYHDALDSHSIRLLRFASPMWYHFGLVAPRLLMTTHRLDDLPKYVAWSYTWVPPPPRMTDSPRILTGIDFQCSSTGNRSLSFGIS